MLRKRFVILEFSVVSYYIIYSPISNIIPQK